MSILAVSGDIGGARTLLPVLEYLFECKKPFSIVKHGFLANDAPIEWDRVAAILHGENSLELLFRKGCFKKVVFSTSIKDTFPLEVARLARELGIYVVCLLDNWMNYRHRLEIDGKPTFLPDEYLVMDDLAFKEACNDGLPPSLIKIVGHPGLSGLAFEYQQWLKNNRKLKAIDSGSKKKLIAFISEPAESDQGSGPQVPQYRGYTEKTVLKEFCLRLQPFANKYKLNIVSHPREDVGGLERVWRQCQGTLEGEILKTGNGRQAVFAADGIAGMVSILLYEAWLMNKPVISLQPGLCKLQINLFQKREGVFCVVDVSEWSSALSRWMAEVDKTDNSFCIRKDLELHANAPSRVGEILLGNFVSS
jgi:hypothetical protein